MKGESIEGDLRSAVDRTRLLAFIGRNPVRGKRVIGVDSRIAGTRFRLVGGQIHVGLAGFEWWCDRLSAVGVESASKTFVARDGV